MRTILIVEDNYMIADMVEDTLLANGYEVCGIAGTVAQGLELYRQYSPVSSSSICGWEMASSERK